MWCGVVGCWWRDESGGKWWSLRSFEESKFHSLLPKAGFRNFPSAIHPDDGAFTRHVKLAQSHESDIRPISLSRLGRRSQYPRNCHHSTKNKSHRNQISDINFIEREDVTTSRYTITYSLPISPSTSTISQPSSPAMLFGAFEAFR